MIWFKNMKMEIIFYLLIYQKKLSFINVMLQYDRDKRYNIDELFNHQFLNKPISEFTKINPNNYCIIDSKIKVDIKKWY